MEVRKSVPRQTGQLGSSVELAEEGCECSIDPVYCISTVKNMRHVSSCIQGDKEFKGIEHGTGIYIQRERERYHLK